ncbi:MAG: autotransporter-associated beta strand repeat-containing protein [Zoogloeaceae bacterium]|nr:autotransporter-associated beta strand repeat-containing protein [Zoogloeaceae bacterium]
MGALSGAGTLTLTGANTYTGLTEVRGGTLELDGGSAAFSSKLVLYDGTEFRLSNGATAALSQLDARGSATFTGDLDVAGGVMNFYVPAAMGKGGTLLAVGGDADVTGSTVNVGIDGASSPLQKGDSLVLVDAAGTLASDHDGKTAAGLAWEHEFDGKAKAKTNGYNIDAPKLKGDTGAAELGLVLKPAAASPLSLELGVQGYAGRREGVAGSVRMRYEF